MKAIRECIGMPTDTPFINYIGKAKAHGTPTDFVPSLAKHVSDHGRHHGMNKVDREYTNQVLDPDLMKLFGYKYAPSEVPPQDLEGEFAGTHLPKKGVYMWWLPGAEMNPSRMRGPPGRAMNVLYSSRTIDHRTNNHRYKPFAEEPRRARKNWHRPAAGERLPNLRGGLIRLGALNNDVESLLQKREKIMRSRIEQLKNGL